MFLNTAMRSNKKKTRNNDERNGEDKKNHKQYQIIKIKIKYDNQDIKKNMKLSLIREVFEFDGASRSARVGKFAEHYFTAQSLSVNSHLISRRR